MKKRPKRNTAKRTTAKPMSPEPTPSRRIAPSSPEPDPKQAERLLLELLAIAGPSGQEGKVVEYITKRLVEAGASKSAIRTDRAHRRSPLGGEVGNLVFRLPGSIRGPRRLLMAHMDTVPLAVGARPVVRGDRIVPADKQTALGGDNRSGVAAVLTAALEILRHKLPHPPLTFYWTVQEECGLIGTRCADVGLLGSPQLAFNFDGGDYDRLIVGATGSYRMTIDVHGIASHAGTHPEQGASAITIASVAIARLHEDGWLGLVKKGRRQGTSNVGVIAGGDATNVVTPHVRLRAEARSHDPVFRKRIVEAIEDAFEKAARDVHTDDGRVGRAVVDGKLDYESYRLADDAPAVVAAEAAVRAVGGTPTRAVSNGGLDASWITTRVAPTVSLGAGQVGAHTAGEYLRRKVFAQACRVALRLALG